LRRLRPFRFPGPRGISNQLAQNEPFSGENQFNFSNGYRITLSGEGPMGVGNAGGLNYLQSTGTLPWERRALTWPIRRIFQFWPICRTTPLPSMEQGNLQVQRELPGNIVASVPM
jgi:hypothetical protein